jgi:hypothetical protein
MATQRNPASKNQKKKKKVYMMPMRFQQEDGLA